MSEQSLPDDRPDEPESSRIPDSLSDDDDPLQFPDRSDHYLHPSRSETVHSDETASHHLNKVAAVTATFWILKICATTLGETAGDLLSMTLNIGYGISSIILISLFLVALAGQMLARKFHPVLYWTVILATSTAGTTISDYMDRTLGLGYATGVVILVSLLIAVLVLWKITQKNLSVDRIASPKAEMFYWAAILCSNTLGTALGDFLADSSGLGFFGSAALISSVLLLILLAYFFTSINRVGLFWAAFVLTRPFGATFGDLLTKPVEKGGLGFGTVGASLVLGAILIIVLAITMYRDAHPKIEVKSSTART